MSMLFFGKGNIYAQDENWSDEFSDSLNCLGLYCVETDGNNVYVGGWLLGAGQATTRDIARWDGTRWHAMPEGGLYGNVHEMVLVNDSLYVVGEFPCSGDFSTQLGFVGLYDGSGWSALGTGLNDNAYAVAYDTLNRKLYVGGIFTTAGGIPANYIAVWDGNSWDSLNNQLNGYVESIEVDKNGDVYVGGYFTDVGGDPDADYIVKWDGSGWQPLGSGLDNYVADIGIRDTLVYVGGGFNWADTLRLSSVGCWDGSKWNALGNGLIGQVYCLDFSENDIIFGGQIIIPNEIVRWDGSQYLEYGSGVDDYVYGVCYHECKLYVAGRFNTAGSKTSKAIAMYNDNPVILSGPDTVLVCPGNAAAFSVTTLGSELSYQWQKDGADLPGEINDSLVIISPSTPEEGAYRCIISNFCGIDTSQIADLSLDNSTSITITSSPEDTVVCIGDTLSLSVTATGSPLNYQWRKNGTDMPGETSSTLTLDSVEMNDAAAYTCYVYNYCHDALSDTGMITLDIPSIDNGHPGGTSICERTDYTYIVIASGTPPLTYRWQKDGVDIPGADSSTYPITNANVSDQGNYTCIVSNYCGSVSNTGFFRVSRIPDIIREPSDTTICLGDTAVFTISILGADPFYTTQHQWKKNGMDITGETDTILVIPDVSLADTGSYTCHVSNPCGDTTSIPVHIIIKGPEITVNPIDVKTCTGKEINFSVAVSDSTSITYQWQKDGADLTGETDSVLVINPVATGDTGFYRCIVEDAECASSSQSGKLSIDDPPIAGTGDSIVLCSSDTAYNLYDAISGTKWAQNGFSWVDDDATGALTDSVFNASQAGYGAYHFTHIAHGCGTDADSALVYVEVIYEPEFVIQPQDIFVCGLGDSVAFTVNATGTEPIAYQWQMNSTDIPGETDSIYIVNPVSISEEGEPVNCLISNACKSVLSNTVKIEVENNEPLVESWSPDQDVCENDSISLYVSALRGQSYQWRKNGVDIPGAVNVNLVFDPVAIADSGDYDCIVANPCGTDTSGITTVVVGSTISITSTLNDKERCLDDSVSFAVTATGANIKYQWHNGIGNISGAKSSVYVDTSFSASEENIYYSALSNSCITVNSDTAMLTVYDNIHVTGGTNGLIDGCLGQGIILTVHSNGNHRIFQWQKDGTDIPGADSAALVFDSLVFADSGSYRCIIHNNCSADTSWLNELKIRGIPEFIEQPEDETVCENWHVEFSVTASGGVGFNDYQWQKDGIDIALGVISKHVIANAQYADEGLYRCIISNACYSDTSDEAMLTIREEPPVVTLHPVNQWSCEGDSLVFMVNANDPSGSVNYQWQKDSANISGAIDSLLIINPVSLSDTGEYRCVVQNLCGFDTVSEIAFLNIDYAHDAGADSSISVCSSDPVFNLIDFLGGIPEPGGDWFDSLFASFGDTYEPSTDASGAFYYIIPGCPDDTALLQIANNPSPVIDLGADTMHTSSPDTITLDAGAGFISYLWQDNSTGQTYNVSTYGTYVVIVTDSNACEGSDSVEIDAVTGIDLLAADYRIVVFPNPAKEAFNIVAIPLAGAKLRLEMVNAAGQVVYNNEISGTRRFSGSIDVEHWQEGFYFLRIISGNETKVVKLVVH